MVHADSSSAVPVAYPGNPVLVRVWRGGVVESQHRGAWVLTDDAGHVIAGEGTFERPVHARSSIKSIQVLPLLETGAAAAYDLDDRALALAISSHEAEPCHTESVLDTLARIGLGVGDLRCGPQMPGDRDVRRALIDAGDKPSPLHNNCSGKHAGFLALSQHLGVAPEHYLDPESEGQMLIRAAVGDMVGRDTTVDGELEFAIDGCSAPTWLLSPREIATAFARMTSPGGLEGERRGHCERITGACAAHPVLIAGSRGRICTDIVNATGGRLFAKIGAEAVYAVGEIGGGRAFAVKMDDGGRRGLHALVVGLLAGLGLASAEELQALDPWRQTLLRNRSGLEVGRIEVLAP